VNDARLTSQTRRALDFYGGYSARATLSQMPSRTPVLSSQQGQPMPQQGKPFQSVQSEPTISPYLNLYREQETSVSVPLYFTSVRPQQEQQEANRAQQREMQKLRGQLQNVAAGGPAPQGGFRGSARYMDTGQFYRGLQR
jgi:hypothetical protein